jgi:hypothetical protein
MSLTLGDIEKKLWRVSGWTAEQDGVDEVMVIVDEYVRQGGGGLDPKLHAGDVEAAKAEGYTAGRAALTVEDLPEAERQRLDALRSAARSEGYTLGFNEGVSQDRAPVREEFPVAPPGFVELPEGTTGALIQAPDGSVWGCMGTPQQVGAAMVAEAKAQPKRAPVTRKVSVAGTSQLTPGQRKCRVCGEIKDLETEFYRDAKGNQGRKTQCSKCESVAKAERKARKG